MTATSEDSEPGQPLGLALTEGLGAWVSTAERLPEEGQSVAFVVRASNRLDYLNGRVLGGYYRAGPFGGFGVPGLIVDAWYWMPLPAAPHVFNTEDPRCIDGAAACTDCMARGACLKAPNAEVSRARDE